MIIGLAGLEAAAIVRSGVDVFIGGGAPICRPGVLCNAVWSVVLPEVAAQPHTHIELAPIAVGRWGDARLARERLRQPLPAQRSGERATQSGVRHLHRQGS